MDDLIRREEAIRAITEYANTHSFNSHYKGMLKARDIIEQLPKAELQEKTGHWIDEGFYADGHSQHAYRCSECDEHYIGYVGEYKRCPNCRAKMEVEQNG